MPTEKIYYAVVILLAAVSVLLSPFFYIRRNRKQPPNPRLAKRQWNIVLISNLLIIAGLIAAWYIWLRPGV